MQIIAAELATGTQIAVGNFRLDPQSFEELVRATQADAAIILSTAGRGERLLDECVGAPIRSGVVP